MEQVSQASYFMMLRTRRTHPWGSRSTSTSDKARVSEANKMDKIEIPNWFSIKKDMYKLKKRSREKWVGMDLKLVLVLILTKLKNSNPVD